MYDFTLIGLPISLLTEERVSSLILEGKDPFEVLKYKFPQIPTDILEKIISIDPTKKKSYSQWLCRRWAEEEDVIIDNLKNGRIERLFWYIKEHPEMQIKDLPSLLDGIKLYLDEEDGSDTVLGKSDKEFTYVKNLRDEVPSNLANDFDIVFKEDNWIIAVPNTYEASCKLGEGMKWCTANAFGNGRSFYHKYLEDGGKYYVNFDLTQPEKAPNGQNYPYTRYQFHFESKQFMDKNDSPINCDRINIPESVFNFYEEQGYDVSDIKLSDEARLEMYYDARCGDSIRILDDVYLNQEWDDNYEYEQPNENTDFYLFDGEDDRDPIEWTEFRGSVDIIKYKNEEDNIAILEKKGGGYSILCKEGSRSTYRDWHVYDCEGYVVDNDCIISIDNVDNRVEVFKNGLYKGGGMIQNNKYTKGFVNRYMPNDMFCVELIDNNNFHTLVELSPQSRVLVPLDIPRDNTSYKVDDSGYIYGVYSKYRVYGNDSSQQKEATLQIERALRNGDLLVYYNTDEDEEFEAEYGDNIYNIMNKETHRLICPFNFGTLIADYGRGYIVEYNMERSIITTNGERVGRVYGCTYSIDINRFVYCETDDSDNDIIDMDTVEVITSCQAIDTSFGKLDDVICITINGGVKKLYNLKDRDFVLKDYSDFKRIKTNMYSNYFYDECILGRKENENSYTLIDYKLGKPLFNNITDTERASYYRGVAKITFSNNTKNLFDTKTKQLLLPGEPIEVRNDSEYDSIGVYPYQYNTDKIFFYNITTKSNMINPNGVDMGLIDSLQAHCGYKAILIKTHGDIEFYFFPNGDKVVYSVKGGYPQSISNAKNDPRMLSALSQLTGTDYTNDIKEEIKKGFCNFYKRIL